MNRKSILVVEDDDLQRRPLVGTLSDLGFEVVEAADGEEALEKAHALGDRLDVVSLDMELKNSRLNGGQVGLEILASHPDHPPEFLVASAKGEQVYYRLAIALDVAAYLEKPIDYKEHIRHLKALALRRALSLSRPQATQKIKEIATQSRSKTDAVVRFCREILAPELEICLGAPFLILFNGENGTQVCTTNTDLPEGPNLAYKTIQALALGEGNRAEPFILNSSNLDPIDEPLSRSILDKLDKSAFMPLSVGELKLSLGILEVGIGSEVLFPENAKALCKVLAQYLKPTVIDHMLTILTQWTELESKRKTILINTAQFCLSVGQEQLDILQTHNGQGGDQPGRAMLQKLRTLAEDLRDTGGTLLHLSERPVESYEHMAPFLKETWAEIVGQDQPIGGTFKVEGNCIVQADSDDLYIVTSRMLQWFRQRWVDLPEGGAPIIIARCAETNGGSEISFEDRSRRLSKRLREELFTPFSQAISLPLEIAKDNLPGRYLPFYLAKMLVEEKYRGVLEDHSDEILDDTGHRFVIRFPESEYKRQNTAAASA